MTCSAPFDRMKSRSFYLVVLLIVVSTVSLWLLASYPTPVRSIVSKTQSGIRNLPSNIQIKEKEMTVNPLYLHRLGLSSREAGPKVTHASDPQVSSVPVIATAAKPDLLEETAVLLASIHRLVSEVTVLVFDLGLSTSEKTKLSKLCNSSWSCEVQTFLFDKYPSHLSYLDIPSYRPVCIQEVLHRRGMVVWVDGGHYFVERNLTATLARAQQSGIQAWPLKDPTSSFTHLKMFQFFHTDQGDYYFQHAVESSHLVVYAQPKVKDKVMLPWVKCALLEDCINPPGAQNSGCIDFRKPLFKYRGCHKYDMSALNIILGRAFQFDERPYAATAPVFGSLSEDKLRAENRTKPRPQMRLGIGQQIKL